MKVTSTRHIAGPLIDTIQKCARCGIIICDYSNTMVLNSSSNRNMLGFQPGIDIIKKGPMTVEATSYKGLSLPCLPED